MPVRITHLLLTSLSLSEKFLKMAKPKCKPIRDLPEPRPGLCMSTLPASPERLEALGTSRFLFQTVLTGGFLFCAVKFTTWSVEEMFTASDPWTVVAVKGQGFYGGEGYERLPAAPASVGILNSPPNCGRDCNDRRAEATPS